ncbi:MAG: HAD-IA family hydrolase [Candidatus Firestonebacteria bacterium]
MIKKVVIFDFDGTLADTLPCALSIINRLSHSFGYKKIIGKNVDILRNKRAEEILEYLGIPLTKLYFMVRKVKTELNKKIEFLKPTVPIRKVLLNLKKNGYRLGILTSNSKDNVSKFLKRNSLDFFDFIYSESSIFGKSKVITGLLKNQNLKSEQVVYIGDETRDIDAAKRTKINIIAVSWGLNSKQILKELKPDFLISKPQELMEILVCPPNAGNYS